MAEETRQEKLVRLGLAPGLPPGWLEGGRCIVQGQSLDHLASMREQELAELAALREKRANSPGHFLAGNEQDRLNWLERTYGTEE